MAQGARMMSTGVASILSNLVRTAYTLLMWCLQPVLRFKLQQRAVKEPGYALHTAQRFGVYDVCATAQPCLWVHAVSLGETKAAALLLQALRTLRPDLHLVLTHGTATGRLQGATLLMPGDVQVWQPWDTPQAVRQFLTHFKPCAGVLMETEVWPNWVQVARQFQIPLLLVNARMNEKSLRKALRWQSLARPAYEGLTGVWAQTQTDAQRLAQLGAPVKAVVGNLKFDAQPDAFDLAQALLWKKQCPRPVVMLASSREGEEQLWLDAFQAMLREDAVRVHQVQWMVVPRHPQRFDEVQALLCAAGFEVSRRSQWSPQGPVSTTSEKTIWLGDTLGEMALYYGLSDVALLGGSFEPLGGQNLIEATACGCPVIMGPHTYNFEQAAQHAQEAGAAVRVEDMGQALLTALEIATSSVDENVYVQACAAFTQRHRGAALQTAQALLAYLRCVE